MKPVQSIGIFNAVGSTTVSTLNAIEKGAMAVANTANIAVKLSEWGNEEVEALRQDRTMRREVSRDIYRVQYVMEAAAEVAKAHQDAVQSMASANEETKEIFQAVVDRYLPEFSK